MFKFITILALTSQVLAMPGMGGMGMNPWMSQWMTPGAAPWAAWMPQQPATGPGAAPPVPPAAPAFPGFPAGFPAFGKGGMAFGAMNKQLGMNQAVIGNKIKAAQDEVKVQLDLLKSSTAILPEDECSLAASSAATAIESQVLTAFDACKMKDEMNQMRLQGFQYKQQMASLKMAKKACKLSLDPATCLADATAAAGAGADPANPSGAPTLVDINAKADQCIADVKDGLFLQIDDATEALIDC